MRLIDIDALPDDCWWCGDEIIEAINNAPTVEAERTGKWIYEDGSYFCSECREFCIDNEEHEPVRSNFCPNCGARLKR